jgi:phage I-like protein
MSNELAAIFKNRALIGPAVALGNGAEKFQLPADGMFHLVPKGEFPHSESGLTQVLDDNALTAIFNDLRPRGANTLIDDDHFSYDLDKSSDAMGWGAEMYELRADGIWGRPRWSDLGEAALKNGRKRFISPVFLPQDVQPLGGKRVRPLRLDTWGLTNAPNMRGMVPLSNRHPASAGSSETKTKQQERTHMKSVAQKLGLSADAAEEVVLAEVVKLQNRAETAEKEVTPLKNRAAALEGENKMLLAAQADVDLAPLKDKLSEEEIKPLREQLLANRAATLPIVKTITEKIVKAPAAMFNRAGAKTPGGDKADERIVKQAVAVRDYQIKNRCSYQAAWDAVRAAQPDLFAEKP